MTAPGEDFNPRSVDSMLATILANQERHAEALERIAGLGARVESRVADLEREKWYNRGVLGTIAVIAPAAWDYFKTRRQ